MVASGSERRRFPRVACELPVRVCHEDSWIDGTAANMSLGGMLLRLEAPVPVHAELSVHCVLGGSRRMHINGQVVRRDDQRGEVGIAFARMSAQTTEDLRRDLERRLERNGALR